MTVKDLKEALSHHSDDLEVLICEEFSALEINAVVEGPTEHKMDKHKVMVPKNSIMLASI